jgi:hypothetical protein
MPNPEQLGMNDGPFDAVRDFLLHRVRWRTELSRSDYLEFNGVLLDTSEFYRDLSIAQRAKALHRTVSFMRSKHFVGANGLEVTDRMRLIVSFAAVKLTFGLSKFKLPFLHTIQLFPNSFYSKMIRAEVKGLSSESGTVSLSWEDIEKGISDPEDGLHLAVHEMAHAFLLATWKGKPEDDRFAFYLSTWLKEANEIRQHSESTFLRAYGKTNIHEFFAVTMENFVERPRQFAVEEPRLFAITCYLLNQDPLNPTTRELTSQRVDQLSASSGIRFPDKVKADYTHHTWHWSYTVLIFSSLFSPWLLLFLSFDIYKPFSMWHAWFVASLAAALLLYRRVVVHKAMTKEFYPVFSLVGSGPLLLVLVMLGENNIPWETWTNRYEVRRYYHLLREDGVHVDVVGNDLVGWEDYLDFPGHYMNDLRNSERTYLELDFQKGPLGTVRCTDHRLIFTQTTASAN